MRVYEGSPRQDFQEVLRSIGAFLDERGMRQILLAEAPDGFIVQGIVSLGGHDRPWSEPTAQVAKETLTFLDEDVGRFMEEAASRRGHGGRSQSDMLSAGYYEQALRVLGRYIDQQKPRDVFFFEQDGSFVLRLLMNTRTGARHIIAEFTREEIEEMIRQGPAWRASALRHGGPQPPTPRPLTEG
jgi:hypothetical protein